MHLQHVNGYVMAIWYDKCVRSRQGVEKLAIGTKFFIVGERERITKRYK